MAQIKKTFGGMVGMIENVEWKHFDKNGNVKKMWQDNKLGLTLLNFFRSMNKKYSVFENLAIQNLRIPFITGFYADSKLVTNGITDAGRAIVSGLLNGSGAPAAFTSIGQGIGTTAFDPSDTALETGKKADGTGDAGVHALASGSVSVSIVTTTITNDTAQWQGTIAETAGMAITESGVFNNNTAGTMLCRQTFSAINVVSGDSLQLTWKCKNS